ncbi:hypothetical protein LTR08_003573 [Meristemomyces frigidus]|nr:hypothetical protein LTR08_003573 [Meristemomyces frigidus]
MAPTEDASTKSGIHKLSNGDSIIPASTRPDGTMRKAIRVKPGYKPPEDVEVYKNRTAATWKDKGKGGVPGAAAAEEKLPPHAAAAAAAKNAKRREARKKAASAATEDGGQANGSVAHAAQDGEQVNGVAESKTEDPIDPKVEAAKEARKLVKKLRQARDLKARKDKGDGLLPEQLSKVIKISELIRQLDGLGFDADGEKKGEDGEPAG